MSVAGAFQTPSITYTPPNPNTYGPKDAWDLPAWTGDERDAAEWIMGVVGPHQRRIVVRLVAAGPDAAWTGDLRHTCGYDDATSLSGVFKAIGGRFRSVGLRPVWIGGEKARFPELASELGVA